MGYTKEERLEIGRRIYTGEITRYQAAAEYGICEGSARTYMRLYRDANNLPAKHHGGKQITITNAEPSAKGLEELQSMTKEELIMELVKARIAEARLKKGYEVKGDGSVILYGSKNTR